MEPLYFLVVAFVMPNPQALDRPLFVYYKPNFQTYEQCYAYANKHNQMIYGKAAHHYDYQLRPESIFCLTGDKIKEIHSKPEQEKQAL